MIKFDLLPGWAYIAAVVCLCGASGATGWKFRDADYQRHLKADVEAALDASVRSRAQEAKGEQIATETGRVVEAQQERIEYLTRTLIKEVPTYVTVESNARCVVPNGFVRVHDYAATGSGPAPDAASGSNDDASGVDLSTVATTVVDNYGYTRELEAQVIGWQTFYGELLKERNQ